MGLTKEEAEDIKKKLDEVKDEIDKQVADTENAPAEGEGGEE